MATKALNAKKKMFANDTSIEAIRGMGRDVIGQILGSYDNYDEKRPQSQQPKSGDLTEGQAIDLSTASKTKTQKETLSYQDIEGGFDYRREILHGERKIARENTQIIEMKIQEIVVELKRLAKTSKVLEVEFKEITAEQRIVKPGKYHVSFFEWLLTIVKTARIRVEDSGAWLSMFQSKKAKRQYWNMFKKHGTTFGLSNERIVATQTG